MTSLLFVYIGLRCLLLKGHSNCEVSLRNRIHCESESGFDNRILPWWYDELRFHFPLDTKYVISETHCRAQSFNRICQVAQMYTSIAAKISWLVGWNGDRLVVEMFCGRRSRCDHDQSQDSVVAVARQRTTRDRDDVDWRNHRRDRYRFITL